MLLCLLSGFLTGLTFVFKDLCFLNIFTLIPLFFSLENGKKGFLKGFFYFAGLNAVTMSFFFNMHPMEFMGLTGIKSFGLIILMYLSVVFFEGAAGGLLIFLFTKYVKKLWFFPLVYALVEIILSLGKFGLTLSDLYITWYKITAFIQSSAYLSGYFITFIIVFINLLIYKLIRTKNIRYLSLAVAVLITNFTFGSIRMRLYQCDPFEYDLALIQGNISSLAKWEQGSISKSLDIYEDLSREAKEKYNVSGIIWPETVIVTPVSESSGLYKRVSDFAKNLETDIYTGTFYSAGDSFYNSLIGFDKKGKAYPERYDKRHLIPFAEDTFEEGYSLKEGKFPICIDTVNGKAGPLICIDSAYPQLACKTANENPDYLLVISNDSWFTDSFGVESHFAHSVFRAVENNKYLLRSGNTGISAFITPKGEIKEKLNPVKQGYIVIKKGEILVEEK